MLSSKQLIIVSDMSSSKDSNNLPVSTLSVNEQLFRHLMDQTTVAVFIATFEPPISLDLPESKQVDLVFENGTVTGANKAWASLAGFESPDELLGIKLKDLLHRSIPENVEAVRKVVESGFTLNEVETVEFYESGKRLFFNNYANWVVEKNKVKRLWGSGTDVTAIKTLERELGTAESGYRFLLDKLKNSHVPEADSDLLARLATLTPREREVMMFVLGGMRSKEIAAILNVVEGTVKIHRRRIMMKMKVESLADLVRMCLKAGVEPRKGSD